MLVSHGDIAVGYLEWGQAQKKESHLVSNREGLHPFGMKSLFANRYLGVGFKIVATFIPILGNHPIWRIFFKVGWNHMVVSQNGGTQQSWVFLLKWSFWGVLEAPPFKETPIWIIWHWHFHHGAPKNCLRNSFRHLFAQTGDWRIPQLEWPDKAGRGSRRQDDKTQRFLASQNEGEKTATKKTTSWKTKWWFQTFFIFTHTWVNDPIWLWVLFFRWVETTNYCSIEEEWQPEWCWCMICMIHLRYLEKIAPELKTQVFYRQFALRSISLKVSCRDGPKNTHRDSHRTDRKLHGENRAPQDWQVAFVPWWCRVYNPIF